METKEATYEELAEENATLRFENIELKAQVAELRRLMFGSTSESRGSNHTPPKKKRKK